MKSILKQFGGSFVNALLYLFPDIGIDASKFIFFSSMCLSPFLSLFPLATYIFNQKITGMIFQTERDFLLILQKLIISIHLYLKIGLLWTILLCFKGFFITLFLKLNVALYSLCLFHYFTSPFPLTSPLHPSPFSLSLPSTPLFLPYLTHHSGRKENALILPQQCC